MGFIPLRDESEFFEIGYKNSSYIWGPGTDDAIGNFLAIFTPKIFKTVPVGEFAGQEKYWPWFWLLVPVYLLVPVICFLLSLAFDFKSFKEDMKHFPEKIKAWPKNVWHWFVKLWTGDKVENTAIAAEITEPEEDTVTTN